MSKVANLIGWKPRIEDPRVASTRIRCLNPIAELQSSGYPVELFNTRRSHDYAAVVYSKLYDDATYHEAVSLQKRGARVVFDLCDNHFYNPTGLRSLNKARAQLHRMMELADELVASTPAIEDAVETEILNIESPFWDCWWEKRKLIELQRRLEENKSTGRAALVWFGIHGGANADYGMLDLLKLRPILEKLNRAHPLSLTIISNSRRKYVKAIQPWAIPTYYLNWHPDTVIAALRCHAIGVIPVSDNPFTRCKSNNRLAFSLNAGLAVVADAIPSYADFSDVCFLGEWQSGLERYLSDSDLRRRHVEQGRTIVARQYSIKHISQKWRRLFDKLWAKQAAPPECHPMVAEA
jgi:hypothetical protein